MAVCAPSSTSDRWTVIADRIVRLDRPLPLWHRLCHWLWKMALGRALHGDTV